jgi:hypothetical protein
MTEQESGMESSDAVDTPLEPRDVGNRLMRTVAWLAVAAVGAVLVALVILLLYLFGIV